METTAIILAGGLGTRLKSVVNDLPKCMAPVAQKPFLHYVLEHLHKQGVGQFIFSVGYLYPAIQAYLLQNYPLLKYQLSIEDEPLGTGGALKLACQKTTQKNVLVVNGDTLFKINVAQLLNLHSTQNADCTLSLKLLQNFERYGVVELNADNSIASFKEKQFYKTGLINGGVYALNVAHFLQLNLPTKFSFENDYLEKFSAQQKMYGCVQDEYFIDIGVPEDFEKANNELS